MAIPRDLTKSGLFYQGGDFAAWEGRVRTILRVQGIEQELQGYWFLGRRETRKIACNTLLAHTHIDLLTRIPDDTKDNPGKLLFALEKLARPFRFPDLPAELRNRVYAYVMPEEPKITLAPIKKLIEGGYPPMTATSRQVRAETVPIYFARCTLKVDLCSAIRYPSARHTLEDQFDRMEGIDACVRALDKRYTRYLRKAQVMLWLTRVMVTRSIKTLEITFSVTHGLQGRFTAINAGGKPTASLEAIRSSIARSEKVRSGLGLQGEGIVLALTRDENLWDPETLRLL